MPFYVGGSAGMRNMGTYAAGTTYFPNDLVQYNGTSYIAIATTTGNLPTNATYWGVLAAGSGFNTVSRTATGAAVNAFDMVLANAVGGAFTVPLPTSPATNAQVVVKKTDVSANVVTVSGAAIEVSGTTTYPLSIPYAAAQFTWDGSVWRVSGSMNVPTGGAINQVLTKNSATNFDTKWTTPSAGSSTSDGAGNFPQWVGANRLFPSMPFVSSLVSQSTPGVAITTNYNWCPVIIPNACTITGMYVWYANTPNSAMQLSLWNDVPTATSSGPGAWVAGSTVSVGGTGGQSLY